MVSSSKRRRSSASSHQPKSEHEHSVNELREACVAQQSALSTIRKEVQSLSFIVDHLNKDVNCIWDFHSKDLAASVESQCSLLNFLSAEAIIVGKTELEAQRDQLQSTLSALQEEHKLLIEQQVSSEESMLDELAKLMSENESLKKLSVSSCSANIGDLASVVQEIEAEVGRSVAPEAAVSHLQSAIQEREAELKSKAESLIASEVLLKSLESKIAELENLLSANSTEAEGVKRTLEAELEAVRTQLSESELANNQLQQSVSELTSRLLAASASLDEMKKNELLLQDVLQLLQDRTVSQDRKCTELEQQNRAFTEEIASLGAEIVELKGALESKQQRIEEQNCRISDLEGLQKQYANLEEAHSCLLDITKEKDNNLAELQARLDTLGKEHVENDMRVRELITINAELLDTIEASKRNDSFLAVKEEQIVALNQALNETKKLADLRGAELERTRIEKTQALENVAQLTEKCQRLDEIEAENQSLRAEADKQRTESKSSSKSEVILRIEVEKLKESLNRERKLNELKIIDLEEQVESLRSELSLVKQAEERRASMLPSRDNNENENIDPFLEAKDKLGLLTNSNNRAQVAPNPRVLLPQGTPPQECLQQ